ncbi:MAG: hypothetical protein ED557_09490 [Balneola sp.]|nr:MAG: hypothetical protein ED557_09490 [Balneola sp.]
MRDFSKYNYMELYDMLTHINPYKYPERITEVENELALRKQRGEVPDRLIPEITFRREDLIQILKSFGVLLYVLFLSFLAYVFLNSIFEDGQFKNVNDFFFAFNTLIAILAIIELKFLGKVKYLKYILLVYLLTSLTTFALIIGVDKLALP